MKQILADEVNGLQDITGQTLQRYYELVYYSEFCDKIRRPILGALVCYVNSEQYAALDAEYGIK